MARWPVQVWLAFAQMANWQHIAPYQITSEAMKENKSKSWVVGNLMCVRKLQKHSLEFVSQFTVGILPKNESWFPSLLSKSKTLPTGYPLCQQLQTNRTLVGAPTAPPVGYAPIPKPPLGGYCGFGSTYWTINRLDDTFTLNFEATMEVDI